MIFAPQLLLIGAVAAVGVLHTLVPDHWVPITLIARQRGWTQGQTARAALKAGTGHVVSTLIIALIVWGAGVAFAEKFGHWVDTAASLALIGFGGWIAISSLLAMRGGGHGHSHSHSHNHEEWAGDEVHGPELQRIETDHGELRLSIFEAGVPPRFRLTGADDDSVAVETIRGDGTRQSFAMVRRGTYWESADTIPEPHQFAARITTDHGGHSHSYDMQFSEHSHGHDGHDHGTAGQRPKMSSQTALLLILGSSPMVEGIPAFFAAGKYGIGLIVVMSLVFGIATIITYMLLCVYSTAGLQRVSFGPLERYGEVLSGAFIALVGVAFWVWPVL
jgi:ABC-type nickel/cobalt efflux system permease component RcnA